MKFKKIQFQEFWKKPIQCIYILISVKNSDSLGGHLRRLSLEAEGRLQELSTGGGMVLGVPPPPRSQGGAPGAGAATGCAGQGADQDKQLHHWERRTKALKYIKIYNLFLIIIDLFYEMFMLSVECCLDGSKPNHQIYHVVLNLMLHLQRPWL